MARDRIIYAAYDVAQKVFFVSLHPPDAPVRPSVECSSLADVQAIAKRRRARVFWWPKPPESVVKAFA